MSVNITTNVPESEQMSEFQNATLQSSDDNTAISIATHLSFPDAVTDAGPEAIARYVELTLNQACKNIRSLSFEVQIGESAYH